MVAKGRRGDCSLHIDYDDSGEHFDGKVFSKFLRASMFLEFGKDDREGLLPRRTAVTICTVKTVVKKMMRKSFS